jgi:PAS domain S-box-containing protein
VIGVAKSSRDTGERERTDADFQRIVDAAPDAMIYLNESGHITLVNAQVERLFGYPAEELVGQSLEILLPEELRDGHVDLRAQYALGPTPKPMGGGRQLHGRRRNGSRFPADISLAVVESATQHTTIAAVREVSFRQAAQSALYESEELFRQLAANVGVGITLRGVDPAEYIYVNPGLFHIMGLDPAGPIPTLAQTISLIHPDDMAQVRKANDLLAAGRTVRTELRIVRPDGSTGWVRATSTPVLDADNVVIRVAGTVEDITDRRNSELALRESEERFRQMADSVSVGFTLRQIEPPEFLYISPAFLRIMGFDEHASPPSLTDALSMIHPDDIDRVMTEYWLPSTLGTSNESEFRIIRPGGEVRWLRSTSSPVRESDGSIQRAASTAEDITDRRAAQEELRAARTDADRANVAKSEFLSRMSHELRTPLNAVLGFAQLLELDPMSDDQSDAVRHILRGGRHLLELINDVLDISRIETDQLELSMEPVQVAEVLFDTIGLMRPLAEANNIEVHHDPGAAATATYVMADRRRLRQVVLNLLSNSIKYNKRGGEVVVTTELRDEGQLRLTVTDTGIGIRGEDIARLFTPFDRLGERSANVEGIGIGLALSQRLVALMGGVLSASSEVDVGSSFSVRMPIAQAPEARIEASLAEETFTHTIESTLLYIEDNLSNVQLVQRILSRRPGWRMVHAGHGALGRELAEVARPNLILLDLHLPDMNGIDVLRELHADARTSAIPLVIVSADANPQQISRLRAAGATHYMTKPLNVADVLAVLDQHAAKKEVSHD